MIDCVVYRKDRENTYVPIDLEKNKVDFKNQFTELTDDSDFVVVGRLRQVNGKWKVKIYQYCGDCVHLGRIFDTQKNRAKFKDWNNRCMWHNVGRNKDSIACKDIKTELIVVSKE